MTIEPGTAPHIPTSCNPGVCATRAIQNFKAGGPRQCPACGVVWELVPVQPGPEFTPAELVRRAPDGGYNDLTIVESEDVK